jgi:CheY-like chemotaxis protein
LSNAIKFSAEGGLVTIRARAEGERHFRLEVEDQGIGISDSDLPRLFVEFQQLDAGYNKLHQGTGLGLALTRRLVEAQGGRVGVRSQPGVGSVFHLILPRVPLAAEVGQSRPESAGSTHHRFLVIEDNPGDQALITRVLAAAGFNVDAASTGEQAIHHALNNPYDALTLNLMLPDQSGLGVLARIRNDGLRRDAPVLGMSMSAFPEKATRFSIADVLSKPIRSEEIVAAMAKLAKPGLQPARVLVIDDDPLALELMATTLAEIGIEAVCRLDARAALRELDQHRPDAIILDLMMPEFDGFAVLDALGRFPEWKDLPVYIWTSLLLTDEEYASLARSARAILSKGGGALGPMLESLSRWRPPTVASTERSDS